MKRRRALWLCLCYLVMMLSACAGGGGLVAGTKLPTSAPATTPGGGIAVPSASPGAATLPAGVNLAATFRLVQSVQPGQIIVLRVSGLTIGGKPDQAAILVYTVASGDTPLHVLEAFRDAINSQGAALAAGVQLFASTAGIPAAVVGAALAGLRAEVRGDTLVLLYSGSLALVGVGSQSTGPAISLNEQPASAGFQSQPFRGDLPLPSAANPPASPTPPAGGSTPPGSPGASQPGGTGATASPAGSPAASASPAASPTAGATFVPGPPGPQPTGTTAPPPFVSTLPPTPSTTPTVDANSVIITGFAPPLGGPGTVVTLLVVGNAFTDPSQVTVAFNGATAAIQTIEAGGSQIKVTVPTGATTGPITVTNAHGSGATNLFFTVLGFAIPTLDSVTPSSGVAGTTVTITGTNLDPDPTRFRVTFNGVETPIVSGSTTQLVVQVPSGATSGRIQLKPIHADLAQFGGLFEGLLGPNFAVGPPVITSFSPQQGNAGQLVTIQGQNFDPVTANNSVTFNGLSATVQSVINTTAVAAFVPAGVTAGPITVTTPQGTATSAASFTPIPPPSITGYSPGKGPAGTEVTITGTGFSPTASENQVYFNSALATVKDANQTSLTVTVPDNATTGMITVIVNGQFAFSGTQFVTGTSAIAALSPTSGKAGDSVMIAGQNFDPDNGGNTVRFNGVDATLAGTSSVILTALVPSGATTGKVTVATSFGGTATSGQVYTVGPPTVTGFSPTSGSPGTVVTITGSNFDRGTASGNVVSFTGKDQPASTATDTTLTVVVPDGAGSGQLTVRHGGGSATSVGTFVIE